LLLSRRIMIRQKSFDFYDRKIRKNDTKKVSRFSEGESAPFFIIRRKIK